jgi:glycosyltransferase involved in cell wall biosynthesis
MTFGARLDQILAGFADGDAISQEALALRGHLRALGFASEIFADSAHVSATLRGECRALEACRPAPEDGVIYHYAISSPAGGLFSGLSCRRILIYHNITPADYFRGFDDAVAGRLKEARSELRSLAGGADDVWADSAFNAEEVRALGISNVKVLPLLFSPDLLDGPSDPRVLNRFAVRLTTLLFVGRIVPNKRVERLIETFFHYHKKINPHSRLVLVGSAHSCPRYYAMLGMYVDDLELPNVCFERFVAPAELGTYYRCADVFVTASEHEGYCLPLIEAMHTGVPVIARAIGGMPEALGDAGILYDGLSAAELAELVHRVVSDSALREEVLLSQTRRIESLRRRDVAAELCGLLGVRRPA